MNRALHPERRRPALVLISLLALGLLWDGPEPAAPDAAAPLPDLASPAHAGPPEAQRLVASHLLRHAHRTGLSDPEIRHLARVVVQEARRNALDPSLVLAVMHVESRYDTYAVSHKHAMGLMQIMPATGAWFAPQVDVEWVGPQTLFDPVLNVRIGVAYLKQLLDRYDGDLPAALAAYNWGPGRIDRFLARGRPLPTEYAQLVLAAYQPPAQS